MLKINKMKTTSRTIETKEGKVKVNYSVEYTLDSKTENDKFNFWHSTVIFTVNGIAYEVKRTQSADKKTYAGKDEYTIGRSVLANEKQVLEYIFNKK